MLLWVPPPPPIMDNLCMQALSGSASHEDAPLRTVSTTIPALPCSAPNCRAAIFQEMAQKLRGLRLCTVRGIQVKRVLKFSLFLPGEPGVPFDVTLAQNLVSAQWMG